MKSKGRTMKKSSNTAINTIFQRRSVGRLSIPGPSEAELITILRAGASAPDHKVTRPFWFTVFEGEAREEFGDVLVNALIDRMKAKGVEPTPAQLSAEKQKLTRAPLVIAVAAKKSPDFNLPDQEIISAGAAAAQNMLLAATSYGYGSIWRTGEMAYDPSVKAALGLTEADYLIGFIYIGSYRDGVAPDPNDPSIDELVRSW